MATPLHSPKARGYDSWLGYWHHANDYWSFGEGTCADSFEGGATGSRPQKEALVRDLWRYNGSTDFQQHSVASAAVVDRDVTDIGSPARDLQNADFCSQTHQNNSNVTCVFEEQILLDRVLKLINGFGARQANPKKVKDDTSDGMFLLWSSHLVHMPLQAPAAFVRKFSDVDDPQRQMMRAMTNFLDDAVGQMIAALEANGLWNDTLIVGHADNGGEFFFDTGGTLAGRWPKSVFR